eukprot:3778281-Prymnesium_polylepis.1
MAASRGRSRCQTPTAQRAHRATACQPGRARAPSCRVRLNRRPLALLVLRKRIVARFRANDHSSRLLHWWGY